MPAETLRCPSCGAGILSDSTRCSFCGAGVAAVACPHCFGMMFAGAKFCSHCGARGDRSEAATPETRLCPRCNVALKSVTGGTTHLLECGTCEGIWLDMDTLQQICAEREAQAAVLNMPEDPQAHADLAKAVRYIPCPVCHQLMNRENFAHCSAVIVDICRRHGTWFDKDELRRVVEFIRAGGLEKARTRELEEIKNERRRLEAVRSPGTLDPGLMAGSRESTFSDFSVAGSAIDLLFDILR
jgi:Zn-finger nucleic acid-binding protein